MGCTAHFLMSLEQGWARVGRKVAEARVAFPEGNAKSPSPGLIHDQTGSDCYFLSCSRVSDPGRALSAVEEEGSNVEYGQYEKRFFCCFGVFFFSPPRSSAMLSLGLTTLSGVNIVTHRKVSSRQTNGSCYNLCWMGYMRRETYRSQNIEI